MARRRKVRWLAFLGIPAAAIIALILLWNWDWFIPPVAARASAMLGRKVTIAHLHVHFGRPLRITADGITIANPPGFPANEKPLATIQRLALTVNLHDYLHGRHIVVPSVDVVSPVVSAVTLPDGRSNYKLQLAGSSSTEIGKVSIEDGRIHFVDPKLRADFRLAIATRAGAAPQAEAAPAGTKAQAAAAHRAAAAQGAQIVATAHGTYAGQKISGHLIGGALLSLREKGEPYPIDLRLADGPTRVTLVGTVQNPLAMAGADLKLALSGPNLALLYPLTGIPIPETPAYRITGNLNYADHRIRFDNFAGIVGTTDVEGTIAEDPGDVRPDVTLDLHSRRVNLADLGGFIGTNPGTRGEANLSAQQRTALARGSTSPHLLPATPIKIPKMHSADIHLRYVADHIQGRSIPFDRLSVVMDDVGGRIELHPVSFGIGRGEMGGTIVLAPQTGQEIDASADVSFRGIDLSRLLGSAGVKGAGLVDGRATLKTTGNSIASFLGRGNGGVSLYLTGGNLSAFLVDLSGLEFGNALLSALGMPERTPLRCFVADFALDRGILQSRALLADTGEAVIHAGGGINLQDEAIRFRLITKPKHFTIGSLPAPITIDGTLKHPHISVGLEQIAARGAIAVALGFLAAPLALLPTIQLGTGPTHECASLVAESRAEAQSSHPGRAEAAVAAPLPIPPLPPGEVAALPVPPLPPGQSGL